MTSVLYVAGSLRVESVVCVCVSNYSLTCSCEIAHQSTVCSQHRTHAPPPHHQLSHQDTLS